MLKTMSVLPLAAGLKMLSPPVMEPLGLSLPVVAENPCPLAIQALIWSSVITGLLTECAAPLTWLRLTACSEGKLLTLRVPLTGWVAGKLLMPIFPLASIAILLAGVVGSAMLTVDPPPPLPPPTATLTSRLPDPSTCKACPWLPDLSAPTSVEPSAFVKPDMRSSPVRLDAAIDAPIVRYTTSVLVSHFIADGVLAKIQPEQRRILDEQRRIHLAAHKADLDGIDLAWIGNQEPLGGAAELRRD